MIICIMMMFARESVRVRFFQNCVFLIFFKIGSSLFSQIWIVGLSASW